MSKSRNEERTEKSSKKIQINKYVCLCVCIVGLNPSKTNEDKRANSSKINKNTRIHIHTHKTGAWGKIDPKTQLKIRNEERIENSTKRNQSQSKSLYIHINEIYNQRGVLRLDPMKTQDPNLKNKKRSRS